MDAAVGTEAMRHVVEHGGPVPPAQWREFAARFRPRRLPRRSALVRAGDTDREVAFVVTGLLRIFYTRDDGREFTKGFVGEGAFVAPLDAMFDGTATRTTIEALEDSDLLVAPFDALDAFTERDMAWQRFRRIRAERMLARKTRREEGLLLATAAERLAAFRVAEPELVDRIPDYLVAGYLGITPEALSRVKARR